MVVAGTVEEAGGEARHSHFAAALEGDLCPIRLVGGARIDLEHVEPRNRLETILGAYKSLAHGATLKLTVDHDPSCMELTLRATEPEGSFEFQTVEHGPEVWRAEVVKR